MRARLALLAALMLWTATAAAQTAYVTDNLRLGLHNAADTSDRPFRVLDSGQRMEIVSRTNLYALVRLPDGTQGYVKAAYLVDDKPAKAIVGELTAERDELQSQLDETRSAFAGSAGRIAELEAQVQSLQDAQGEQRSTIDRLRDENDGFRGRLSLYRFSLPWTMVLGATLVALVLGFIGGMWWIDSRSRKRHGGFRIY